MECVGIRAACPVRPEPEYARKGMSVIGVCRAGRHMKTPRPKPRRCRDAGASRSATAQERTRDEREAGDDTRRLPRVVADDLRCAAGGVAQLARRGVRRLVERVAGFGEAILHALLQGCSVAAAVALQQRFQFVDQRAQVGMDVGRGRTRGACDVTAGAADFGEASVKLVFDGVGQRHGSCSPDESSQIEDETDRYH
ncbi:protein of unknown function [Burkholderia multivorans]